MQLEGSDFYMLCLQLVYGCVKGLDRKQQLENINQILTDVDPNNLYHVFCARIAADYKTQELIVVI